MPKQKNKEYIVTIFTHIKATKPEKAIEVADKIIEKAINDAKIKKKLVDIYTLDDDLVVEMEEEEAKRDVMFM